MFEPCIGDVIAAQKIKVLQIRERGNVCEPCIGDFPTVLKVEVLQLLERHKVSYPIISDRGAAAKVENLDGQYDAHNVYGTTYALNVLLYVGVKKSNHGEMPGSNPLADNYLRAASLLLCCFKDFLAISERIS